ALGVDTCTFAKTERFGIAVHLFVAETDSGTLKISVIGSRKSEVEVHSGRRTTDTAFFVYDVFAQSRYAGNQFDRRTRFETVLDRPILVDHRDDLTGFGFHHYDSAGPGSKSIDRSLSYCEIFAFNLVFIN